jgi:hypothetical protein
MATQEIKSTDWQAFCKKFLDLHRGAIMSVVQIRPGGARIEAVRELPLRNVWFQQGDCNDSILLNFQAEGTREITHEIIDPIHVKIREEGQGQKGLQIDAENGSTLVLFSSGKLEELVAGLQVI